MSNQKKKIKDEGMILSDLEYLNIIKYYDCIFEKNKEIIIMKFAEGGNLKEKIEEKNEKAMKIFILNSQSIETNISKSLFFNGNYIYINFIIRRDIQLYINYIIIIFIKNLYSKN